MSQRILKCTVCGGDHSIFHCENRCGVCHGDSRQCSCNERPPQKRKKTSKSTACRYVARRSKEKVRVTAKGLQKSGSGLPEPAGTEPGVDNIARGMRERGWRASKPCHRRTPSGGATQKPTCAIRRPCHKKTHPHHNSNNRHLRQHPQPGQHTRTIWPGSLDDEREQMQHGLCLPSCRLSSEHTTRLRGNSKTEKGRLEGTGPRPPRPRS